MNAAVGELWLHALLASVLSALLALVFGAVAHAMPQWRHARHWAAAYLGFALALLPLALLPLIAVGGSGANAALAAFAAGGTALALAWSYLYLGIREWRHLPPLRRNLVATAVIAAPVFALCFVLAPRFAAIGIAVAASLLLGFPVLCAQALLVSRRRRNAGHGLAAASLLLQPLAPLLAALWLYRGAAAPELAIGAVALFSAALLGTAIFCLLGMVLELTDKLRDSELRDPLTRLYNRRGWMEHGRHLHDQAQRSGQSYAVVLCEICNLGSITAARGHDHGDRLLVAAATALQAQLQRRHVLARGEGGEFLLLLPHCDEAEAAAVTQSLLAALRGLQLPGRRSLHPQLAAGAAVAEPGRHSLPGTLQRAAHAKQLSVEPAASSVPTAS